MTIIEFSAIRAPQSENHIVLSFTASAEEINQFSEIDRISRDAQGELSGFQRPQIANHIREIKDYLEKSDSILPNPIVVAFTRGVTISEIQGDMVRVKIDLSQGKLGLVVDGQQRLSALSQLTESKFKVFVSLIVCRDEAELRRQFVLINNTRPLPKSLIYELLPGVDNLPGRLDSRSLASEFTNKINYSDWSSLKGLINQHTNPVGIISDTAIQKVLMNSLSDGIMRDFMKEDRGSEKCLRLISEFYAAVQNVFPSAWKGHTPKTSRLLHGAGIQSLGYVMEVLAVLEGARDRHEFAKGLGCLEGHTAWVGGNWDLGGGDIRHWKAIQNVNKDINTLAQYLVNKVRQDIKMRRSSPSSAPLLEQIAS